MKNKLKIGVLLDNYIVPAWEYKIIEDINSSDSGEITLIIKNNLNGLSVNYTNKKSASFLFKLYQKIDIRLFSKGKLSSENKDIRMLVKDVPEVIVTPVENNLKTKLGDEDLTRLGKSNLDIIIKFGFKNLSGAILETPRYGIWFFPEVEYNENIGVTAGYFEVVNRQPITNTKLVILKEDPLDDVIIHCSWESTCPFSISLNENKVLSRTSLFIPRIIQGIHSSGELFINRIIEKCKNEKQSSVNEYSPKYSQIPDDLDSINAFMALGRQIFKKLFYTDNFNWLLLIRIDGDNEVLNNSFINYKRLQSSADKFWADPFCICKNGKYYVFVEEFIYKTNRGHISVLEIDEKGSLVSSSRVIEKPYHMSYPFIFEVDSTLYMIPETSENKTIDLYRCSEFPNKWEIVKCMMRNLYAVDTTLFFYKNKWWLFTSIDETNNVSGYDTELFLFFSDDIFTENWQSHPCNPIVSDVRVARSAGKIFVCDDKIYRPSQDCSGRYGRAFNYNQITKLSETEYEETLIQKVEPDWDNKLKGTHTFNSDKNFRVIDAYEFRKRISFY